MTAELDRNALGEVIYTFVKENETALKMNYPVASKSEPDLAGKVTGMLLTQAKEIQIQLFNDRKYRGRTINDCIGALERHHMNQASRVMTEEEEEEEAARKAERQRQRMQRMKRPGGQAGGAGRPGWVYIDFMSAEGPLRNLLLNMQRRIGRDWIHGNMPKIHTTVALKMNSSHIPALRRVAQIFAPFPIRIKETFVTQVERIQDKEIYALGCAFDAPDLRQVKNQVLLELGLPPGTPEAKRHDPYHPSHGHVTIARVKAAFQQDIETIRDGLEHRSKDKSCTVRNMVFQESGGGPKTVIKFTGEIRADGGKVDLKKLSDSAWKRVIYKERGGGKVG